MTTSEQQPKVEYQRNQDLLEHLIKSLNELEAKFLDRKDLQPEGIVALRVAILTVSKYVYAREYKTNLDLANECVRTLSTAIFYLNRFIQTLKQEVIKDPEKFYDEFYAKKYDNPDLKVRVYLFRLFGAKNIVQRDLQDIAHNYINNKMSDSRSRAEIYYAKKILDALTDIKLNIQSIDQKTQQIIYSRLDRVLRAVSGLANPDNLRY